MMLVHPGAINPVVFQAILRSNSTVNQKEITAVVFTPLYTRPLQHQQPYARNPMSE